MALFQSSVLNSYLQLQDKQQIDKLYKKYSSYFHNQVIQENIRSSKEEQYQATFLTELFVNILGYTLNPNPNYNLSTEFKNQKNARKADGAILKENTAVGVIELKGTNTKDLESIRRQAFDYKANQKGCVYVVTSNFEKLRFYVNDATEFEEFNLFELTREEFSLLYLCLSKENIFEDKPLKIKEASIVEEEKITKKFYRDYSVFKRELYRDLVKRNSKKLKTFPSQRHSVLDSGSASPETQTTELKQLEKNVKLTLFKKSQKLIDRFLFIFFAEDRNLLPPNSTIQILEKWKADVDFGDERPLYDLFKQYFKFLDSGRKGTASRAEIYAYNGGLFKPDVILDELEIDDDLLYKHTYQLASYDFESQVDVNILGHIFENSLNEIEGVNAEIEGGVFEKQNSKRKKDGVFYTPKYITKYIVENTIGKLCEEKKQELGFKEEEYFKSRKNRQEKTLKKLLKTLEDYREWLLQLTICDPACGSGAFLNQALDFLIKEHKYIDELKTKILGGGFVLSDIETTILENNIYGVDINEESVEIAKLSLWLRTAQPRRKLNDLSSNIKCGNSLIADKKVAGDKAFDWQKEFPQVFKEKNRKVYHITTAVHDSRTSARMEKYKVRERREAGTNPYPNVVYFSPEDDFIITKTISEIAKEDQLKILAYNICGDHIHLLLVCELEEIPGIMQKIKSISSKKTRETREHANENTREHAPLHNKNKKPLWQQKYSAPKEVTSTEQLHNTIKYIQGNRRKHNLEPYNQEVQDLIDGLICSYDEAFEGENAGGFDVVIGNPPYVPAEMISSTEKKYLEKIYFSAFGRINLYPIFYEKGLLLLKNEGLLSFITPYTILKNKYYKEARKYILTNTTIQTLVDFKGNLVFKDAAVDSIILTLLKAQSEDNEFLQINNIKNFQEGQYDINIVKQDGITKTEDLSFNTSLFEEIISRISKNTLRVKDVINFKQGIITGGNSNFLTTEKNELSKKVITGSNFQRYHLEKSKSFITYNTEKLHRPRKEEIFEVPQKILLRQTGAYPICMIDNEQHYTLDTVHNGHLINEEFDLKFLLAILNSKLFRFLYETSINEEGKVFAQVKIMYIENLPIKSARTKDQLQITKKVDYIISLNNNLNKRLNNFSGFFSNNLNNKTLSRKLQNWHELEFSEFIKELNKAIKKEKGTPLTKKDEFEWMDLFEENKQKATSLQNQITQTDKEIDQMVYELYGLTEEEIGIVENS